MTVGSQTMLESVKEEGVGLRYRAPSVDDEAGIEPQNSGYVLIKGAVEWLMALSLVVGTAPLVLVLALCVKASSKGPAFYAQTRLGRYGRHYRIFKLRTMVHNAEAKTGPVWAAENDWRITRIGRLLRDTHLDELPQLWNILRGEMSLIGPRPERPEIAAHLERHMPQYPERLKVRPGITGLAQMLVPADDPNDPLLRVSRLKLSNDLMYVREMTFLLDVRIAFSTFCHFFSSGISSVGKGLIREYGVKADREIRLGTGRERAAPAETARV